MIPLLPLTRFFIDIFFLRVMLASQGIADGLDHRAFMLIGYIRQEH